MEKPIENPAYFSSICVERCGGLCCDPWWGIISFKTVKEGGLSGLSSFRALLIKGLKEREKRIRDAYVTGEKEPRPLFGNPVKYNVFIKDAKADGRRLTIEIMAMFAFRCNYLSPEKSCLIHPALLGGGDIRPPHCGFMGSPDARPGEKGYCRVIHAAAKAGDTEDSRAEILSAIEIEKKAGKTHLYRGVDTVEEAADIVISQLRDYCNSQSGPSTPVEVHKHPGRNDPCWCGSNAKFKKCHGR